ncbi:MAG: acyl-phosphate glycerol 3-phosphate acyltransferase [Rhodospirillales bacterium]|jgi:1-acyl-sn-glycerol-3-phosphate acyltransferase|nr:acyl-phosphate glycerol 3-phosphate acyltransferase [Rhodospirillales bacterium]
MIGSPLMATGRLTAYLLLTLILMPVQALALLLKLPISLTLPRVYHTWCRLLFGLHVELRGKIARDRPVLFVSNHSSYLDIMVLGSLLKASFVAKTEVADYPLFGWLAKLQRTVFVDRRRSQTQEHAGEIQKRLAHRDNLIIFPEGTSSDGNRVLPFKSALLGVAQIRVKSRKGVERGVVVQPVSITAAKLDGMPLGRNLRHLYAWYGDMDMAGHMWTAATLGRLTIVVEFHEPFEVQPGQSRKEIAERCWDAVARGVSAVVSGRGEPKVLTVAAPDDDDPHEADEHEQPDSVHEAA